MAVASDKAAEELLKKLRRQKENATCPNCGTLAPHGIGFGSVCVKFKTFVCDLCKTSHQAISHRVKSVSMSTWTMEEVLDLTKQRLGGNQVARHVWLSRAPSYGSKYQGGVRPKAGDRIENFKQFVVDCYEHGMFKATTPFVDSGDEDAASSSTSSSSSSSSSSSASSRRPGASSSSSSSSSRAASKAPAATAEVVDLLGGPVPGFDTAFAAAPSAAPASADDFFGGFSAPTPAPAPALAFAQTPPVPAGSDNRMGGALGWASDPFASAPAPPAAFNDPFGLGSLALQPQLQAGPGSVAAPAPMSAMLGGARGPAALPLMQPQQQPMGMGMGTGMGMGIGMQARPAMMAAPPSAMGMGAMGMGMGMGAPQQPQMLQQPGMGMGMGMGMQARPPMMPMSGQGMGMGIQQMGMGMGLPLQQQQPQQPMMGGGMRPPTAMAMGGQGNSWAIDAMPSLMGPGSAMPLGGGGGGGMMGGAYGSAPKPKQPDTFDFVSQQFGR